MKKIAGLALLAFLAVCAAPRAARADTPAFTPTDDYELQIYDYILGYTFTLSAPVQLTKLGYFDHNGDGLDADVTVFLWDSAGNLLTYTALPTGVNQGEIDGFLYEPVSGGPVILPAGTYTIGGWDHSSNADCMVASNAINPAPGVTFGAPRSINTPYGPTIVCPTGDQFNIAQYGDGVIKINNSYFGPNFEFNAVPEPSTWALLGVGAALAGVGAIRRRRRMTAA